MSAVLVAGARPNFMKVAPVLWAMRDRVDAAGCTPVSITTRWMSDAFFAELDIPTADVDLGIGPGSHAEQTAHVMIAFGSRR